jgi:hypothetical protein
MPLIARVYGIVLEVVLQESEELTEQFRLYKFEVDGMDPEKGKKQRRGPHKKNLCKSCRLGKCPSSKL